ncbi:MAG: hypothetical protein CL605_02305 [Altibacter sp.]|uniref:hypothetical protein n=1 Tax=Altibacter sp. TaxID=2024823 RepID=UPI000C8EB521|nr:hypothetical protein [Altibacter sp.]MAP53715.1 hypothetical protein [Altibacter sp.]|tara:strand:+ start:13496 stop:13792 length:297 start_codon:yes stop_codon:yes gene_type:complete
MGTHNQSIKFENRGPPRVGNNKHFNNIRWIKKYLKSCEDNEASFLQIRDWLNSNTRYGITSGALANVLGYHESFEKIEERYFTEDGKNKKETTWRLVE